MDSTKFLDRFMAFQGGRPVEKPYTDFYITGAVVFFRDYANGMWLIKAIYQYLPRTHLNNRQIIDCELTVSDGVGTLVMRDHNSIDRWTLHVEFPKVELLIDYVPLYCQRFSREWVLMTPHESLTMITKRGTGCNDDS